MNHIENWKEGAGLLLYFGLLAYFVPKAREAGYGTTGICLVIFGGLLFVGLLYLLVKFTAEFIAERRESIGEFMEFMGAGADPATRASLAVTTASYVTEAEIDTALANNPYTSFELDPMATRQLAASLSPTSEGWQALERMPQGVPADLEDAYIPEEQLERDIRTGQRSTSDELPTPPSGKDRPSLVPAIIGDRPNRRLDLAPNFQPDANAMIGTGVLFVAMPGGGKTVALARLIEQYQRFKLPGIFFDIKGTDFRSLVEEGYVPNGIIATPGSMPSMKNVLEYRLQVVFDLPKWINEQEGEIYEQVGQMMAQVMRDLLIAARNVPEGQRRPCLVGLDETHQFAPQKPSSLMTPLTGKRVNDAIVAIATTGRSAGITPLFATQRMALTNLNVIAGVETRILGKTDLDNDLTRYREYVSAALVSDEQIRSFGAGQMVVCMDGKRCLVQFTNRDTHHGSHTPRITGSLVNAFSGGRLPREFLDSLRVPAAPASIDSSAITRRFEEQQPAVTAHIVESKPPVVKRQSHSTRQAILANKRAALQAQGISPSRSSQVLSLVKPVQQKQQPAQVIFDTDGLSPEVAKAYLLWIQGPQYQSVRKLEEALKHHGYPDITHYQATEIYKELKAIGYIEVPSQQRVGV